MSKQRVVTAVQYPGPEGFPGFCVSRPQLDLSVCVRNSHSTPKPGISRGHPLGKEAQLSGHLKDNTGGKRPLSSKTNVTGVGKNTGIWDKSYYRVLCLSHRKRKEREKKAEKHFKRLSQSPEALWKQMSTGPRGPRPGGLIGTQLL